MLLENTSIVEVSLQYLLKMLLKFVQDQFEFYAEHLTHLYQLL